MVIGFMQGMTGGVRPKDMLKKDLKLGNGTIPVLCIINVLPNTDGIGREVKQLSQKTEWFVINILKRLK